MATGQHIIWQIAFRYVICDLGLKCFISRLKLQKRLKFLFQNLPNVQILFCCWVTQSKSSKADWKYTQIFLSRSKSQNSIQVKVRVNVIHDPCQFQTMVSLMMIWEWKCWVLGCILWKSGHDRTELRADFLMFSMWKLQMIFVYFWFKTVLSLNNFHFPTYKYKYKY